MLALALSACTDQNPFAPEPLDPAANVLNAMVCAVDVRGGTMECRRTAPGSSGARFDRIVGGQDYYVKLTSSGTAYDAGTERLQSNVTLQNLLQQTIGTTDSTTATGVRVFFAGDPVTTSGSGIVTVANADGTDTFLGSNQPYFLYNQMLEPYEISDARNWQFSVPATVATFSFTVYVSAPMTNESAALLGAVWTGATSADWADGTNWAGGVVPDSGSVVTIPADTLVAGSLPVLPGDARVLHLRVGAASTLNAAGYTIQVDGNVDAVGAVTDGTTRMTGSGALLRGTVDDLAVSGSVFLQGTTRATGAVNVTGVLTTSGNALTISLP